MNTGSIRCIERNKSWTAAHQHLIVDTAKKCMRELGKNQYSLGKMDGKKLKIIMKDGEGSWGGVGGIVIGMKPLLENRTIAYEYKSYQKSKLIGQAKNISPELVMKMIVAHEVAHHVQYEYAAHLDAYGKRGYGSKNRPHGELFQMIYGFLRAAIINPLVAAEGGFIGIE